MEQNVIHSLVPPEPIPKESFGQHILKCLLKGGSQVAMVDSVSGKQITYSDIRVRTISLAKHFKLLGLQKNDVILICSENSLNFFIPSIAAMYLGIITSAINPSYVPREIVHAMNICKPKLVFCSPRVIDNMLKAVEQVQGVKEVIVFGESVNLPTWIKSMESYLHDSDLKSFELEDVDPDHPMTIMYSSGTTGLPKGVMLTNKAYLTTLMYLKHPAVGNLNSRKIALGILPFFHSFGFTTTICHVALNMKTIVLPLFEEHLFLSSIEKYRITNAFLVPPILVFLAKNPVVSNYDLSSFQEIIFGAAPLDKHIQQMVKTRLKIPSIRQGYGMTELTLTSLLQPAFDNKNGTAGVLVPNMSGKVINSDTGKALGPMEEGELCFKGPCVMMRYYGDLQSTDSTLDKDGWLHTGDLGYYDKDGYFYIVDRLKDLIKYKGFQVPPAELEGILMHHPEIKDAAVIGVPDETCGELAQAYIVKQSGSMITKAEIMKYVADNVSYQKYLHGGLKFVDAIPKNPSGKILRKVLRDELKHKSKL